MSDTYTRIMALTPAKRAEVLRDCAPIRDRDLEEQYKDFLDECYVQITFGPYTYAASDVLASVDPTAFRCGFADWLGSDETRVEIEGRIYGTDDVDEMLDAHAEDAQ